ncbi:MAG: Transketolase [Elusimicrobia bacterium ADurb.Bin231]|nr:MAG: Transketolase [Elusimicrobia bacterium ADurb.Bin231]
MSNNNGVISFPKDKFAESDELIKTKKSFSDEKRDISERMFIAYRAIVNMLFNYVQSGHPGGSISAGRIMLGVMLNENTKMDISDLDRPDSDVIGFAAGHKALGLYSFLGLIYDIVKLKDPKLYNSIGRKIRFEDLLGFRKNPATVLPLMKKFGSKRLDGHPTPETPGVVLATGASGVGFGGFGGYAFAKKEYYDNPPVVNIIEGEGGMTPGRVHENLAHFWALSLWNLIIHVDWNNASIDTDSVCSSDGPGQYVNWKPHELGLLHGYNVVYVNNGMDVSQIKVAQDEVFAGYMSKRMSPNMIVYKTVKGEGYIVGRKSHGAGYKFDSDEYFNAQKIFEKTFNVNLIKSPDSTPNIKEEYLYKNLLVVEKALANDSKLLDFAFNRLMSNRDSLNRARRTPKKGKAEIGVLFSANSSLMNVKKTPQEIYYKPGSFITLRESLGKTLSYLNRATNGGFYGFAADLVGSTSLNLMCVGFPEGFVGPENPFAKIIPTGICEDGGSSIVAGISATGHYIGVGSSYATFIGPMSFTAARLFAIAYQAKHGQNMAPLILINAHAGLKTGEDGPTHACPQTLTIWKSFSKLKLKTITLTPWDANEIWPLMITSLKYKPVLIVPYVTRPSELIVDRKRYGFPEVQETSQGIYYIRKAKKSKATVLYQGAEVGVELPNIVTELDKEKVDVNILYVSSAELFSYLPAKKQEEILPAEFKRNAMAITGYTIDTMYEYLLSEKGRDSSLHPFKKGIFLGSGPGGEVLKQAGLDVKSQISAIKSFIKNK